MSRIANILTNEPATWQLSANTRREEYVEIIGMNCSCLCAGLLDVDAVDPAAVKLQWESPELVTRTLASQDSLDRGTLAHLILFQPDQLADRVAVWYGGKRNTSDYHQFEDDNFDKLVMRDEDYRRVSIAINAMRSRSKVADLIDGIAPEVAVTGSVPAKYSKGHILVKGQVDAIHIGRKLIVDLKTTEAGIDTHSVKRTIQKFNYREKMAKYRRWVAAATETDASEWKCCNLFMSMKPPYGIQIAWIPSGILDWAEDRMQMVFDAVDKCLSTSDWPIYCNEMFVGVDDWEMDEDDEYAD